MVTELRHGDAHIHVEELASGQSRINVALPNNRLFSPSKACETCYPIHLVSKILEAKGPAYLCDEILREESPGYVQKNLRYDLLTYLSEEGFVGKRLLDFGCGSGASTMILSRMFPHAEIVGIELEDRLLSVARARANYYGYSNVQLMLSPSPDQLPPNIGSFDFVVLSAVYEHLLPNERRTLLPTVWNALRPGGILFLDQTPSRYFPIEKHTTGLPFINYLPNGATHLCARSFSKRNLKDKSWQELLRMGIRGASVGEILKILNSSSHKPMLLRPSRFGAEDRIDLWYIQSNKTSAKKLFRLLAKGVQALTGVVMLPELSLAIEKQH